MDEQMKSDIALVVASQAAKVAESLCPGISKGMTDVECVEVVSKLMSHIKVEEENKLVTITCDILGLTKEPPFYGLISSALVTPIFQEEIINILKGAPPLNGHGFAIICQK